MGTTQGLGEMSDSILWRWIRNTQTLVVTHLVAKSLNQVHDHQDLQVQVPLNHHLINYLTNIIPHRIQNDQHRGFVFDHFVAGESVSVVDGQFHAKKTRFEVTTSKTSFLGPNLLVRPHVVH